MKETIMQYVIQIITSLVLMAVAFIAKQAKNAYVKHINTQTKIDVAYSAMMFVEQIYKDVHGPEKLNKALDAAEEELAKLGIQFTNEEMLMFIESAVSEFNANFKEHEPQLIIGGTVTEENN